MSSPGLTSDRRWMLEALDQARQGEGLTRPNPPVGAVLVQGGEVVGRGVHWRAGGPHAEIHALQEAGKRACGATLYVTLEPCSTAGRTGACTDAIRAAGVRRVVVAARDPNPVHSGRGLRILRRAGLDVDAGVEREAANRLIDPFRTWVLQGRPFVSLKLAMTLDGRIADRRGASKWITGPAARVRVQAIRRTADAVLVGANTVRADDPSLLPRPARGRRPFRVIVLGRGRLPAAARVCTDRSARRTLVAAPFDRCERLARRMRGASVQWLPVLAGPDGRVDLPELMRGLAAREVLHVVCEGGGRLAEALVRAELVDEFILFYGPSLLGRDGRAGLDGPGWCMDQRPALRMVAVERVGHDLMIRARPKAGAK